MLVGVADPASVPVLGISPAFATDRTVFAAWSSTLYWSTDGGDTWRPVRGAPSDRGAYTALAIPVAPAPGRRVIALTFGLQVTLPADLVALPVAPLPHWRFSPAPIAAPGTLPGGASVAVVVSARDNRGEALGGTTAYVAFDAAAGGGTASIGGVALTATPQAFTTDAQGELRVTYTAPQTLPASGTDRLTVQDAASRPVTSAATGYAFGTIAGGTWAQLPAFDQQLVFTAAFSRAYATDGTAFVATERGIERTTDGGVTWEVVDDGLRTQATRGLAVSPGFDADRTVFLSDRNAGLLRSTDGGDTWQRLGQYGISNDTNIPSAEGAVVLSPDYAHDGIVFAAGVQAKTLRSDDGGDSWHVVADAGVPITQVVMPADFAATGRAFAIANADILRSTDRGRTWSVLASEPSGGVDALAASPDFDHDHTMLAATGAGLYRSTDAGAHWSLVADGNPDTNGGTMPTFDGLQRLGFSASFSSNHTAFWWVHPRAYRSVDGGATWGEVIPPPDALGVGAAPEDALPVSPAYARDRSLYFISGGGLVVAQDVPAIAHIALEPAGPAVTHEDPLGVTVRVTDEAGAPLAGVTVQLRSTIPEIHFGHVVVTTGADGTATESLGGTGRAGLTGELDAWIAGAAAPAAVRMPFSVVAGVPSAVTFSCVSCAVPTKVSAGVAPPLLKVAVLNGSGDLLNDYSGPVSLEIAPGTGVPGATLGGTTTVNADHGLATFDDLVSIDEPADGYRLTATLPNAPGVQAAVSAAFDVVADLGNPPPGVGRAVVGPDASSDAQSPDGAIDVSVPQGAVQDVGNVWIEPRPKQEAPPPPPGKHIVKAFKLDLLDTGGHLQRSPHFTHPLTIRVKYTQADLASVNGDTSRLRVTVFLTSTNAWQTLRTTVDTVHRELVATVDHFTLFAIQAADPVPPPVIPPVAAPTSTPTPTATPAPLAGAATRTEPGGVAVDVVHEQSVTASATVAATVTSDGDGASAVVEVPAGALGAGTTVRVGEVADLPALVAQAPPPAGALATAFEVNAAASDGAVVHDGFAQPVTLRFTVGAAALPAGAAAGELTVAYWDGSRWATVESAVTANDDGTFTLVATTDHFTLFAVLDVPGFGTLAPAPRSTGVNAAEWQGGSLAALHALVPGAGSLWVFRDGRAYGWIAGAPAFVTQGFDELFPSGMVPVGEIVLVVRP